MITLVLICYAIYTAVMYLITLCLYCCPGKRVSRYLGDLHASGLIVGLNCRSPDQKHPVKINILLLLLHRKKQRFCGGHLGLQDDRQDYKCENVPIGFANLKNVYLDSEIIIVWPLYAEM